ncbi:type IX secretion system membrane protein, PorP/SprF family [Filimonas lacunae]|uniref:Type IX secretion system membrane protein, PorP/SprF family n=1 Tax=Filimonas lacunae TaxID=477680 RepID=A0A173MF49_9BACT|nr:PorP/SprF family type IX secretion system membrane protein [Filimonas lacunae]BAV06232.1 hypothetical protein FLA_2248 [Filimonas lacunae]SIT25378.1 type IX secretion system membrane protein, PorP/SprF family [Filimonas lacunae]
MKKYIAGFTFLFSAALALPGKAQLYYNNPVARFYRNTYLANPAYAGAQEQPFVYALVNRSWIGFDGAPTLVQLSGDMNFGKSSGAGIQLANDKSGVLKRSYAKFSYAYKIKLAGENHAVRLGFSLSAFRQQLDGSAIIDGGVVDAGAKQFNEQGWKADGDFGATYQFKGFAFSAAAFNLRQWFPDVNSNPANQETMNLMASYAWQPADNKQIELKPLVAARFFTKASSIIGGGAQFTYDKTVHASAIWQNTGNITGTVGLMLKSIGGEINFSYVTNNKQGYGQQFEVGLGIGLSGLKKESAE